MEMKQAKNYIIIDASYFCFYRYYAILNWFKHAKKDVELTNPIENEDFVNTFKKTFISKIQQISKKLKIDNPIIIVAKDCHRKDIWRMKLLDTYNEKRRKSADIYTSFFKNNPKIITPKVVGERNSHVFHQYTLRIINSDRDALSEYLTSNKIPFGIYYPVPLHLQKAYADKRFKEENFGITNQLINEVISLPMHSELSLEQIDYISDKINKFLT